MLPVPVTIHFNGRRIQAERRYVRNLQTGHWDPVLVAPLRQLFYDLLGYDVHWTSNDEDIIVSKDNASLSFRIRSSNFQRDIDGIITSDIPLGGEARLQGTGMDARTMIPLYAPLRALGYLVSGRSRFGASPIDYDITGSANFASPPLPPPERFTNRVYVLLREIARKNHGGIIPTIVNGRRAYRVLLRGIFRELILGVDIFEQNGFLIVRRSLLMHRFGLPEHAVTHQPWDWYETAESAALAFSLMHTPYATDRNINGEPNLEVGAIIYQVGRIVPHFTFGNTWTGGGSLLGANVIHGLVVRVLLGFQENGRPSDSTVAALAHTHPYGFNWFSPQDMNIAHGEYNIMGIGVPTMPVFLSVHVEEDGPLEVSKYDNTMNRNNRGRLIFSR